MKALIQIFFLTTFLLATLFYNVRFSYLVLFYTFNNESFTELFCENIERPELECNGQCSITAASEDATGGDKIALERFQQEIQLYYEFLIAGEIPSAINLQEINDIYGNKYTYLFTQNFLHPPAFSS